MTAAWALLLALALVLSGCATMDRPFGSGSMRIDVEVYKGPLAQEPWTQWGELRGIVSEATIAVNSTKRFAKDVFEELDCDRILKIIQEPSSTGQPAQRQETTLPAGMEIDSELSRAAGETVWAQDCASVWGLLKVADLIQQAEYGLKEVDTNLNKEGRVRIESVSDLENTKLKVRNVLQNVFYVAMRMRSAAFFLAAVQLSSPLNERRPRPALTNVALVLSEYSNQLITRADALLQQMAGSDRRELPLSLHLRNTNPTDFLNLHVWNRAAAPALLADMILRFPTAFTSKETADRVRGYERLFADYNWSNVNSVYASGQGDVALAFIKDDIGNWNLKTFDNDPAELLKSYTAVGKAALVEAAKAVSAASGAGAGAQAIGRVAAHGPHQSHRPWSHVGVAANGRGA
jgi:hypothetical protein